ncbi:MAG TPA: hypothetical protein VF506_14535 [Streptosporangiaceae bacterium]
MSEAYVPTQPKEMHKAVLLGGPRHGRELASSGSKYINVPDAPPMPLVVEIPKRTWLDRLLRRPVPLPPMPDLTFETRVYERYGTRDSDGGLVYRYTGSTGGAA